MILKNNQFAIINGSDYPVILLTPVNQAPTDAQLNLFFDELEEMIEAHKGQYVFVCHVPALFMSPKKIHRLAKGTNHLQQRFKHRSVGVVLIVSHPLGRRLVQSFNSVLPTPVKQVVVGSYTAAMEAAQQLLHKTPSAMQA